MVSFNRKTFRCLLFSVNNVANVENADTINSCVQAGIQEKCVLYLERRCANTLSLRQLHSLQWSTYSVYENRQQWTILCQ